MRMHTKRIMIIMVSMILVLTLAVPAFAAGTWRHNSQGWWYALSEGGYPAAQWMEIDGQWYHFDSDGYVQTGWIRSGGKWYFVDSKGVLQTGWVRSGGKWYYLSADGTMATGWQKDAGKWYYMDESGVMQTGWIKSDGSWYYLTDSGAMAKGWQQISDRWYYMDSSGVLQTGWLRYQDQWYYLQYNGRMAVGWQMIDGKAYYFDSSGKYTMNSSSLISDQLLSYLKGLYRDAVDDSMTSEQKLRALFEYVANRTRFPYKSVRIPYYHEDDWPMVYATDRMNGKTTDCHGFAALFGYLAVLCGYSDVYWCAKSDHAWVEIGGLVYDPVYLNSVYYCDVFGLTYAEAIRKNPSAGYEEFIRKEGTFRYIRIPQLQ